MSALRYFRTKHSLHEFDSLSLFTVDIDAPALFVRDGQEHYSVLLRFDSAVNVGIAETVYFKLFVCKSFISLFKDIAFHGIDHKFVVACLDIGFYAHINS